MRVCESVCGAEGEVSPWCEVWGAIPDLSIWTAQHPCTTRTGVARGGGEAQVEVALVV